MSVRRVSFVLASAGAAAALACSIVDDEPRATGGGDTDGSTQQSCLAAADDFFADLETGCLPGYEARVIYDGGGSTILLVDDPGAGVGLGVGLVVQFGGQAGADWVGYGVTESSYCSYGCFLPSCQDGQQGCYARAPSIGLCGHYCVDTVDQQVCNEMQNACVAADPAAGGASGEDGGLDETGGGETTGGVMEAPYDCSQWHPETIRKPVPGGAVQVPQAIVDQLVLGIAEPLAECDGVRLRQASDGHWVISRMDSPGLLGALGLRVGDELRMLDDIELDSLDALASVLGRFMTEDGSPRQLGAGHPGFTLRVRRGERDFVRQLRVVPSSDVMR